MFTTYCKENIGWKVLDYYTEEKATIPETVLSKISELEKNHSKWLLHMKKLAAGKLKEVDFDPLQTQHEACRQLII